MVPKTLADLARIRAQFSSADEFNAFLADEVRKYSKVVRDLGLKLD